MLRIENDDFVPRVSLERRRSVALPFSPLLLIDGITRRSCSYNQLPQLPLKLSVLKLDGSSFEIEVTKSATVAELKQAVEGVFSHFPKKGLSKISWPHVWGHFCLCYDGQKLVIENEYIRDYGIKDGDQLHFIRHVAINYNLIKIRSKKWVSSKQQKMQSGKLRIRRFVDTHCSKIDDDDMELYRSSSRLDSCEEKEQNGEEDDDCDDQENVELQHSDDKAEDLIKQHECKLTHFLRDWFSYSRLATVGKTRFEGKARPLRSAGGFCSGVRKVIRIYSNKTYSQRNKWRGD